MRSLTSENIRAAFVDYFVRKGHTHVPSSPMIPAQDPTLLFTNAGMVQFKGVFQGTERRGYVRAVSVQKCMRAGGKHNDLENVGRTARHHTFFEMLGNFSFGDYFKEDACRLAWEFLTREMGLDPKVLWVTIFQEDDEAEAVWKDKVGVAADRILRFGEKDNFWQMGDTGPCGPCSEIYVDQGPEAGCGKPGCAVGCNCDRYLEIWNLVFMQYDRDSAGSLSPLPHPSIDTGMGLERMAAVCQKKKSNYDTDLFVPILRAVEELSGKAYGAEPETGLSMRVVADHARAVTFLISDGVLPSNEGRGYVLRRVIRRAARHGKRLGIEAPFLYKLTGDVTAKMSQAYPELRSARDTVARITRGEEERFMHTLEQGMKMLSGMTASLKSGGGGVLDGESVFKLYDTYGFPLDLIEEIGLEERFSIDRAGFEDAMAKQRARARTSWTGQELSKVNPVVSEIWKSRGGTVFVGYDVLEAEGTVLAILKGEKRVASASVGDAVDVILDRTPFYGESGGQVGDTGRLVGAEMEAEITGANKPLPDVVLHHVGVRRGTLREGDAVRGIVTGSARQESMRNHTATHMLHGALREVLGDHVKQKGSLVAPDRLRFDFSHFSPLDPREIDRIEALINERILENHPVRKEVMDLDRALSSGAIALFDEKYGDRVRVISIGEISTELCGGTHCNTTGDIGLFKIIREGSVAGGVRRIEAVTGTAAYRYVKEQERLLKDIADTLKSTPEEAPSKASRLVSTLKEREREIQALKSGGAQMGPDTLSELREVSGLRLLVRRIDGLDLKDLRTAADALKDKIRSGVVVLASVHQEKVGLIAVVTKDLTSRVHAGTLIRTLSAKIGGSGGGRPDMAQGGGKEIAALDGALAEIPSLLDTR